MLVTTNADGIVGYDMYSPLGQQWLCGAANTIVNIILGRPFHVPMVNALKTFTNLSINQRFAIICRPPLEIILYKNDLPSKYCFVGPPS